MQNILFHPAVAMIVMLGSLVLFHELGHYLAGRLCGVAVEKFAIGFGHRIAEFRSGQTDFILGWIPLGGYVKFYGSTRNEDVPENVKGLLYWRAPVWKRAVIVAAGPFANFLLAFVIFWILVMRGIEHAPPTVGDVIEGGRAQQAGILPGDRLLRADGKDIKNWSHIERIFQKNPEKKIKVLIERKGETIEKDLTPESVVGRTIFGSKAEIGRVGVALAFPSAVVSITSPESFLARDGLRTGDRIEAWLDASGTEHKIHGLHETFGLFATWAKNVKNPMTVFVRPITIINGNDGRPVEQTTTDQRRVVLNVGKWPAFGGQSDRSYAAALGAVDSHLTVGLVRGQLTEHLHPGDRLLAWNDTPIRNIFHLQELMESWKLPQVKLSVMRDYKEVSLTAPLKPLEVQAPEGLITLYVLDASMLGQTSLPEFETLREQNPLTAASLAVREAYDQTSLMVIGLWQIMTGAVPIKSLGGPIMIAKVAGDSAKAGWMTFLASMAVISINLGLVNLFPIPLLDGGQLVLLSFEAVKRSPLEEATVENFQKLGFVMVMSLVILALYNDLSRFWSSIVGSVIGAK
jgi:regulator of sigma E protease